MKKFVLILILISIPNAFSTTLDEVLDSYDFSYESEKFHLNKFNYNNSLNIYLDFDGEFGDYFFVLDFYEDNNFKFRYLNESYFPNGEKKVDFFIPLVFNLNNYDLHLEIYKDGFIQYRNNFKIDVDEVIISNNSGNLLFFNESFEKEKSLEYVDYEKIFEDDLIGEFVFNFNTTLEDGSYLSQFYFAQEVFKQEIKVEDNGFSIIINTSKLFELDKNGYLEVFKLLIFEDDNLIQTVLIDEIIGPYYLINFSKPNLPDFTFIYNDSLYVINNGTLNAQNISFKIVDSNLNIVEDSFFNLSINETFLIDYNLSEFYIYVDYNNSILELNEYSNLFLFPVLVEKDIFEEVNNSIIQETNSAGGSGSSSKRSKSDNIKEEVFENKSTKLIENRTVINKSKKKFIDLNLSEEINLNNISVKPKIKEKLEIVQELIQDEEGFFDIGFLSFVGSIFVTVFSVIFLLL